MSRFFEANRSKLEEFSRVSKEIGARADYVQGGGGNTSVKLEGGLMAIKASGFCLKDIEPDAAYTVLDYEALRQFYRAGKPADDEDVEKTGSAKAREAIRTIDGLKALRPSVEAGFHSILDGYVIHSHSVYANCAACCAECAAIVSGALADADYIWTIVPYANPGARLTFSVRDALARVERKAGKRPAVIIMQNHGIIAHSDDPDQCLRIHADANRRIAGAFGLTGTSFPAVSVRETGDGLIEAVSPFLSEMLKTKRFDESFFLETPLYPDQMVFLTGAFDFGSGTPEANCALADPESGRVLFNMSARRAQVIAETLTAVVFIADAIRKNGKTLVTMNEASKRFIADWESEKYRQSLAGDAH